METSDETLVTEVLEGNTDAFATIVDRYKIQIYNLMYRYSYKSEDAADMTQEVFGRAFERLNRYRNTNRFFSWLYTLALNHAKDWQRKKNVNSRTLARFSVEPGSTRPTSAESHLDTAHQADRLTAALQTLDEDRRELVVLRYRHERSIKELAEIFDISESAVKMRIHRTLDDLRQLLNGNDNER